MSRAHCAVFSLLSLTPALVAAPPEPQQIFAAAAAICQQDAGRLWGHSLCGPTLLFDPATRELSANQADAEGLLKQHDGLWTGHLPENVNAANTAITWAGVRWTMLLLPLPEEPYDRARLLAHEMFHRIQDELGLAMANPSNAHLDSEPGRYWLRLEMRALSAALLTSGEPRRLAIADALAFRAERWRLFANASTGELALERNEGLAEYTGVRLSGRAAGERRTAAAEQLRADRPSFVRSFAYATGPGYGLLLDDLAPDWKAGLKSGAGLSELLAKAAGAPAVADAAARAAVYDGVALRAAEAARAKANADRKARYQALLVDGPKLTLRHSAKMSYGFNPSNLVPLPPFGTVYPTFRLSDEWGVLEVTDGALLSPDRSHTDVAAPSAPLPASGPVTGPGWKLTLEPGWAFTPGARGGDLVVVKRP
jgi:hypothetical protein